MTQDLKNKLEEKLNASLGAVRADSIEFYNAFLFLPRNVQPIYNNFGIIKNYMPKVEHCVVNSFIVKAGHQTYCVHHAADGMIDENFNIDRVHKSFYIFLQDTGYQSQPLVVFDALDNQMFSFNHAYEIIVNEASQEEKLLLDNAIIAAVFSDNSSDLFIGKDYLIAAY